ncbi:hypothetical protein [Ruegeria lacuscaerulensis]|nr:hypothetical protein [Ruegeria lacuscaerulensis]
MVDSVVIVVLVTQDSVSGFILPDLVDIWLHSHILFYAVARTGPHHTSL